MIPDSNETIDLTLHPPAALLHEQYFDDWSGQETVIFVLGSERIYTMMPEGKDLLIGRQHKATGPQPDLDLTPYGAIKAGTSRLHVALKRDRNTWWLIDMNSSNGTWVDEERLAPFEPHLLGATAHVFLSHLEVTIVLPTKNTVQ